MANAGNRASLRHIAARSTNTAQVFGGIMKCSRGHAAAAAITAVLSLLVVSGRAAAADPAAPGDCLPSAQPIAYFYGAYSSDGSPPNRAYLDPANWRQSCETAASPEKREVAPARRIAKSWLRLELVQDRVQGHRARHGAFRGAGRSLPGGGPVVDITRNRDHCRSFRPRWRSSSRNALRAGCKTGCGHAGGARPRRRLSCRAVRRQGCHCCAATVFECR